MERESATDASANACCEKQTDELTVAVESGKLVEPAAILAEYLAVLDTEPTALGVDPEDLAMAWELCVETEQATVSPKTIVSLIDEKLYQSSVDTYKAFRLLTSDLGRIFFKTVNDHEYKAKPPKSVQASKEGWCRDHIDVEYCFV